MGRGSTTRSHVVNAAKYLKEPYDVRNPFEVEIEKHRPLHQKPRIRLFVSSPSCCQENGSVRPRRPEFGSSRRTNWLRHCLSGHKP